MGSNGKMDSKPMQGTRPKSDMPENSGVMHPQRSMPGAEAVKDVKHNPAARKRAHMLNERSQNGGADPAAYPCE